ncbi:FtsW/RodA/SpoVE family cell cycle protein [bacterium]|nr:FtsW/RodA/SpoVE family cell cycle protein [bacterium]
MFIQRTDKSRLAKWWFSLDKAIFIETLFLIGIGVFMIFAASPYSAIRGRLNSYYYINKYLGYVGIGIAVLLSSSFLSIRNIKRLSIIGFLVLFICLIATFFFPPIKGAHRWLRLGVSLQPSEILKPIFAIVIALILIRIKEFQVLDDKKRMKNNILLLIGVMVAVAGVLFFQPDIGMLTTFCMIFVAEVFVAGLAWKWIFGLVGLGVSVLFTAYFTLPHFYNRINQFLDKSGNKDHYQIDKALQTIKEAGLFGSHTNNLKKMIPDVHTDFIFSAMVEEMGALLSIILLVIFFMMLIRIFNILKEKKNPFVIFAGTGIATYFTFQVCVNICSNLALIPTKGMTLPFISYGGSSFISSCLGMGLLLAILQEYNGRGDKNEK